LPVGKPETIDFPFFYDRIALEFIVYGTIGWEILVRAEHEMPEWVQWANENWRLIVIPIVAFVAIIIGGRWLRRVVYDKYNRWAVKTRRLGLSLFVARSYGPFLFWFVLLGAHVAIKISALPIEAAIIIFKVLLSLFVGSWVWVAVGFSETIGRLYLPKVRQYLARARAPQPPLGLVVNGLRTAFIIISLAILINIWKLPNVSGLLVLATALTIGILALREATTGLSKRLHLSYRTQRRLRSVGKVFLSLLVVAGIADIIRRIYLLSGNSLHTTSNLVIPFLEIGFVVWFIHTLRSTNFRRTRPSFKLVTGLFITTVVILAFSSVQPLATYKDSTVTYIRAQGSRISGFVEARPSQGGITEIVNKVCPAVVKLEVGDYVGTGMIIDRTGYVLTCNHLVEDTQSASAILYGGGQYNATVISRDSQKDLAIVKLNATGIDFPSVTLGSSGELEIGQEIIVIGYSLGLEGQTTVSKGIISALRNVEGVDYIQTDAAVNPGNSGGPMLDEKGNVVGVSTFKLVGEAVEGMSFAVAVDSVKDFINETIHQSPHEIEESLSHIERMEREVLQLVNLERNSRNISALTWDTELHGIAEEHSKEMARQSSLFHSPIDKPYAENCWGGSAGSAYYLDASDIVSGWMGSDKHRTWLLCPHLRHIGVGIAVSGSEMYASWTFWRDETTNDDWWYVNGGQPPPWWY
jgi:S1-C subfamily serine protease